MKKDIFVDKGEKQANYQENKLLGTQLKLFEKYPRYLIK